MFERIAFPRAGTASSPIATGTAGLFGGSAVFSGDIAGFSVLLG
jgi:hypothetical protein